MSEIGTLIFVAVFEGPIILLKICEIQLQVYIHCSIYLYAPAPSLKKCNFCHEQIYLSLVGKGLILIIFECFTIPILLLDLTLFDCSNFLNIFWF